MAEFRHQIRRFLHFSEQVVRAAGLEPGQYLLLLMLKGLPAGSEPTIGTLAVGLQLRQHTVSELVDRLEARALIERNRDAANRRRVLVQLTPAGDAVLQELASYSYVELQTVGPVLVRALTALIEEREPIGAPAGHEGNGVTPAEE